MKKKMTRTVIAGYSTGETTAEGLLSVFSLLLKKLRK